jgi:topoisomerase-4 subunit A
MLSKFECRTTDHCIVICDNGRVCSIPVAQLPSGRGDGAPLSTFIDLAPGAKIAHALCGKSDQQLLIATSAGYGFTCALGDMVGRNKAGKQFITVDKEAILAPAPFTPTEHSLVAAVSNEGRLLVFLFSEMKHLPGGGKGVILMGLGDKDELAAAAVIDQPELKIIGKSGLKDQAVKLSGNTLHGYFGKRARGGQRLQSKIKPSGIA